MKYLCIFFVLFLSVSAIGQETSKVLETLRASVESKPVEAREQLIDELVKQKLYDEAVLHHKWLWENHVESLHDPVRTKIFLQKIPLEALTKTKYIYYLEGVKWRYTQAAKRATPDPRDIGTWIVFEQYVGEPKIIVEWFLALDKPEDPLYDVSRPWVFETMAEMKMWKEAGSVFPEPSVYAADLMEIWDIIEENHPSFRVTTDGWAVTTFGNLYRSLLAASRRDDARLLKELVLKKRPTKKLRRVFR